MLPVIVWPVMLRRAVLALSVFVAVVACDARAWAQRGTSNGEWRAYGGDLGSTKYSPLALIDAENFGDLELAWRWASPDGSLDLDTIRQRVPTIHFRMFQATPLMVGGVLYLSTALHQVAAVDAVTGDTLWVHDPQVYWEVRPTHFYNSRGVAHWTDGQQERIFFGTSEAYLIALDAATGRLVTEFGVNGSRRSDGGNPTRKPE